MIEEDRWLGIGYTIPIIKEDWNFQEPQEEPKKVYSFISLQSLRDFIIKHYPNLLWWDGINKHGPWTEGRNYLHRQGMPNEIRIEVDGEDKLDNWLQINLIGVELLKRKIDFGVYYVEGGRSPHIHIYNVDELDNLDYEDRKRYRVSFLNKICPKEIKVDYELCDEKHLCALEFVNHFKYNNPKRLLYYFFNGPLTNTGLDYDLKGKAIDHLKTKGVSEVLRKNKLNIYLGEDGLRDKIISKLSFEEVFNKYKIIYKGNKALCPFHTDKNPSLSFNNERGLWNCFSCHKKGDIITMIKMLEEKNAEKRSH